MPDLNLGKVVGRDGQDATQISVDSNLSTTSTNPVQNKVLTTAIRSKVNQSDIVDQVVDGNQNPVTSNAVYDYLNSKLGDIQEYVNR